MERSALATGRWTYSDLMPIVPILKTGLTPTVQLALLGWASWKFSRDKKTGQSKK